MNEKFARAATLEDLKALITSLNANQVEYMLIGGYALFAHGFVRATTDIDVLVRGTSESGERVRSALMVLPDGVARDIDPAWFDEGENIRVADAYIVDVMLNANGQTYESLRNNVVVLDIDGIAVRTVDIEGLILTKKTVRDKDISDRTVLERALEFNRRQYAASPANPSLCRSVIDAPAEPSSAKPEAAKGLLRRLLKR